MAMDGNNSAKRVVQAFHQEGDMRVFSSTYFLDVPEVDECALTNMPVTGPEVLPVRAKDAEAPHTVEKEPEDMWESDEENGEPGDGRGDGEEQPTANGELGKQVSDCVKNWKAAQSDSKKKVMDMFDETGIFVCSCRHGVTLWVADMVKSGEQ